MASAPPSPPAPFYDSGADSADEVAARAAADAAGLPPVDAACGALSCAACFARVSPRARAAGGGAYRTVYLDPGAVVVTPGGAALVDAGPAPGGKRGRAEAEGDAAAATTTVPGLTCAACGADVGAVEEEGGEDGVPVYVLWEVLPGEA